MRASVLLEACHNAGIDFYTGVPDSFLKGFCDELFTRFGTDSDTHVVAHNEGGAIALCAGHFLSSGLPGLCYMQNSGLGNAVNPLASLMDTDVYSLPCLLLIGWRGEPGTKDEPQHVKQGAITLSMLEILDIPYFVLSPETSDEAFQSEFNSLFFYLRGNKTAAIVARKGSLTSDTSPQYNISGNHLTREEAVCSILQKTNPKDIIVSTTGKLSRELFELRDKRGEKHNRDFLTVGSMGHASMIALRIAVEHPERRIWCLDGDGALLMHLGSLPVIGHRFPDNFFHVIINNGAHETVGGMPVCSGSLNIQDLAAASGYQKVYQADSQVTLDHALTSMLSFDPHQGPVLLEVHRACGARSDLGRPTTTPVQNRDMLMETLR